MCPAGVFLCKIEFCLIWISRKNVSSGVLTWLASSILCKIEFCLISHKNVSSGMLTWPAGDFLWKLEYFFWSYFKMNLSNVYLHQLWYSVKYHLLSHSQYISSLLVKLLTINENGCNLPYRKKNYWNHNSWYRKKIFFLLW